MSYLCLIENNSSVYKEFSKWRTETYKHIKGQRVENKGLASLKFCMKIVAMNMRSKARRAFIFEAEEEWKKFNISTFLVEFLERYGFENENTKRICK